MPFLFARKTPKIKKNPCVEFSKEIPTIKERKDREVYPSQCLKIRNGEKRFQNFSGEFPVIFLSEA